MVDLAIIQARMSSTRLPGKVLSTVAGRTLLDHLVERVRRCDVVDHLVVATSDHPSDDPIAGWCRDRGVDLFRGSLDDVAGRMLAAAKAHGANAFVRLCADSPLLDPALVATMAALFGEVPCDLASNTVVRSFPKGMSVEVLSVPALERAYPAMDHADREHVTRHFYRHPDRFTIRSCRWDRDEASRQLSVDSPEDLERFTRIVGGMDRPHWSYGLEDIIALDDSLSEGKQHERE